MAGYRAKYGGSLLRKVPEQVEKQQTYEKEQSTKHEIAKKKRAEEKARLDEIQVRNLPERYYGLTNFACAWQRQRVEAERARLAEEEAIRERQRQEARSWRMEIRQQEEEEGIKKQERAEGRRSRKDREPAGSGDEVERKPRRKPKKKAKRGSDDDMIDDDEEAHAMLTDDDDVQVRARSKVCLLQPTTIKGSPPILRRQSPRRSEPQPLTQTGMKREMTDRQRRRNCGWNA